MTLKDRAAMIDIVPLSEMDRRKWIRYPFDAEMVIPLSKVELEWYYDHPQYSISELVTEIQAISTISKEATPISTLARIESAMELIDYYCNYET